MGAIIFCDNFNDLELRDAIYWSEDGLHLAPAGHLKVAMNCLDALGVSIPDTWSVEALQNDEPYGYQSGTYYRDFVLLWIGRRLRGQSSGDGRSAKRPELDDFSVSI